MENIEKKDCAKNDCQTKKFDNKSNQKKLVAVVTGASSGIGLATAKMLMQKGVKVVGIATGNFEADFDYFACDVTDEQRVQEVLKNVFDVEGQIDFLVNCAGIGISGSVENSPNEKIKKIFDVNFLGTVNMCKHVIPYMRKNNYGIILNIGSIAGELPIPFQAFYSATKASIQNFSGALSMEVKPFGIKVACVLPGDTKTGFTKARQKNVADDKSYADRILKSIERMEKDEQNGMPAESVAKVICKALFKKHPKPTYIVGAKYKFFVFLSKILPKRLVYKILYSMYAK